MGAARGPRIKDIWKLDYRPELKVDRRRMDFSVKEPETKWKKNHIRSLLMPYTKNSMWIK